jgi:hypothetical protein
MSSRLKVALTRLRSAESDVKRILGEDYPPEGNIEWSDDGGKTLRSGHVLSNCNGDRIEVRNAATHRPRFIRASRIV